MYTMIVVGDMTKLTEIVNVYKASIISFETYAPIYTDSTHHHSSRTNIMTKHYQLD